MHAADTNSTAALHERDADTLSRELERGALTVIELMEHTLDRIDALNPSINAIVSLRDRESLLDEARQADSLGRTSSGIDSSANRGWLHGIPVAIKDLVDTAGIPTTYGSPLFATHVPATDDPIVTRLKSAGAIIIGKTNTAEFGLGSHTYNTVFGTTRNPYDTSRSAGGSSGGAAAALAARLVSVADGSDMMGSLRNPAAFCNVYGFRPTAGLIRDEPSASADADMPSLPLATSGPMGRSVVDIARLLDTLVGSPAGSPWESPPRPNSFTDAVRSVGSDRARSTCKRIGWLGNFNGYYPMEAGVLPLCEQALGVLDALDIDVVSHIPATDPELIWQAWNTLRSVHFADEFGACLDDRSRRDLLKPELVWEIEQGRLVSGVELQRARQAQGRWWSECLRLFEKFDILALPSAQVFPFAADLHWPKSIDSRSMRSYHEWMSVVVPASLIGLPSLNVPVGFSEKGLPMGMQFMGWRHHDAAVLRLGEHYHRKTGWPQKQLPEPALLTKTQ